MTPGILVPLVALPIVLVATWRWYRRAVEGPGDDDAVPDGTRLTAESLHRLESPPWRVVYEIRGSLATVDHVVIGPAGVVAISTTIADRPAPDDLVAQQRVPALVAASALARGRVDDVLRPVGASCALAATVFWGPADPARPAAEHAVHLGPFVEGQRLEAWLAEWNDTTPAILDAGRVDLVWQAVVTGIGRPDPLA